MSSLVWHDLDLCFLLAGLSNPGTSFTIFISQINVLFGSTEENDSKSIDKFVILVTHALEVLYELQMEELEQDPWTRSFA